MMQRTGDLKLREQSAALSQGDLPEVGDRSQGGRGLLGQIPDRQNAVVFQGVDRAKREAALSQGDRSEFLDPLGFFLLVGHELQPVDVDRLPLLADPRASVKFHF